MEIKFWNFTKKTNSTAQPSAQNATAFDIVLKDQTSINNPTVLLEYSGNPCTWNYARIDEFQRYYWISEWKSVRNGLWEVSMRVDVLGTYKTNIGASSNYVLRAASDHDMDVSDQMYPTNAQISTHKMGIKYNDFYTGLDPATQDVFTSGIFIISCVDSQQSSSSINGLTYYALIPQDFKDLILSFIGYINDNSIWGSMESPLRNSIYQLSDFIQSVRWFPDWTMLNPQAQPIVDVYLGTYNTNVKGKVVRQNPRTYDTRFTALSRHPQASVYGNYLDLEPYTQTKIYHPFFGSVEIPSALVQGASNVGFDTNIDYMTGDAICQIYAYYEATDTKKTLLYKTSHVAVDIPLISETMNIQGLAGGAAGFIGSVALAATGNPLALISGATSLASIGKALMVPEVQSEGVQNSYMTWLYLMQNQNCYAEQIFQNVVDRDPVNLGNPLCQYRTLNSLSGYIICQTNNLGAVPNALESEKNEIRNYLTQGFYYE